MLNQFTFIIPEIVLLSIVLVKQIIGVYFKTFSKFIISLVNILIVTLSVYLLYSFSNESVIGFSSSFFTSPTTS